MLLVDCGSKSSYGGRRFVRSGDAMFRGDNMNGVLERKSKGMGLVWRD